MIVVDLGDAIVHIMQEESRRMYELEKLLELSLKLQLIAVGMPDWVQTGFMDYLHRFPKDMPFELTEIPAGKRGKNADIKAHSRKEGELMLAAR